MAQEQTQQPTQTTTKIHVSAGAGIDPATTRSTVDYSNGVRTLQFTTGDRLYVWGSYGNMDYEPSGQEYYPYIIAGYLDLDSDSFDPSNPTNATFTGDLTVYEWTNEVGDDQEWDDDIEDYVEVPYYVETPGYYSPALNFPNISTNDPLADFEDVKATLIHKDAVEDEEYDIPENDRQVYYRHNCATTVEELMTKQLTVSGVYDPSTKSFALTKNANQPILNCTIAGLEDGVSYKVDYIYGATAAMSDHSMILYSSLTATSGTLSFAFFAKPANYFHGILLTNTADANDTYTVSIGQKAFDSKVYNATRTAIGKKTPLTIEAITDGSIVVDNPRAGMKYKKNNDPKTEMAVTTIYLKKRRKGTILWKRHIHQEIFGNSISWRHGLCESVRQHHEPGGRGRLRHSHGIVWTKCSREPFLSERQADGCEWPVAARNEPCPYVLLCNVRRLYQPDHRATATCNDAGHRLLRAYVPELHQPNHRARATSNEAGTSLLPIYVPELHQPNHRTFAACQETGQRLLQLDVQRLHESQCRDLPCHLRCKRKQL